MKYVLIVSFALPLSSGVAYAENQDAATVLAAPEHLILVNNKHPLVPLSTLRAGHRLTIHGLSTEMLHALLIRFRDAQSEGIPVQTTSGPEQVA